MNARKLLKRIHILGTVWFLVCAAALLVISLRQAGVHWWVIFSLSGYGVVLFVFLLAVYLFALFRGVVRAQYSEEHPLSTTPAYMVLYDTAPFLGTAAGLLCISGMYDPISVVRVITEGTLITTFFIWVLLDSGVGFVESLLPQSVRHRNQRLAIIRAEKRRIQEQSAALLASLERREQDLRRAWEDEFRGMVDELTSLYSGSRASLRQIQMKTADVGAKAWQLGQMACMRFVYQMIEERLDQFEPGRGVNYAALWWDGIGNWRRPKESVAVIETV